MKKLFCFLMIGVLALGMVSTVFAEEIDTSPETEVSTVPTEESVVGDETDSTLSPPADTGDSGGTDDNNSGVSVDGSGTELPVADDEIISDGEFVSEYNDVTINADAVYLTADDEAVSYSVGDVLSGGAFFEVDTSELGEVKIYVPIDYQEGSFAYDNNGNLVNIRSATITGYILDGTQYTVRWTSFNTPQYRLVNYSGVSSAYEDLTITSVIDTNIQIVEDDSEVPLFPDDRYIFLSILAVLGVIMLCQFMKA